jgi:hypothetical protein
MLWQATREYRRIGLDLKRGDVAELPAGVAEWVNRDSPGTLELYEGETPLRVMDAPPEDRMVRQAVLRGEAALDGTPVPHEVVYGATKSGRRR